MGLHQLEQQQQVVGSPWPGPRALTQLKLFSMLFPASDRRHPVLTPAALFIGRALSQCVATNVGEAIRGLVLAGLGLNLAAPAKRHFPEALTFLTDYLLSFASGMEECQGKTSAVGKQKKEADAAKEQDRQRRLRVSPGVVAPSSLKGLSKVVPAQADLWHCLTLPTTCSSPSSGPTKGDDYGAVEAEEAPLKLGLLRVALLATSRALDLEADCSQDSFPEATSVTREALSALANGIFREKGSSAGGGKGKAAMSSSSPALPADLEQLRMEILAKADATAAAALAARRPLARPVSAAGRASGSLAASKKEYNPRFEDGYTKGRDYDPDRERAQQRKERREVNKEKRGMLRELRKDASFMAAERDKEKAQVDAERMESQRKFYSELQQQAADLASGGQRGMAKKKRRK